MLRKFRSLGRFRSVLGIKIVSCWRWGPRVGLWGFGSGKRKRGSLYGLGKVISQRLSPLSNPYVLAKMDHTW